jgi:hypothetical protein
VHLQDLGACRSHSPSLFTEACFNPPGTFLQTAYRMR